MATTPSLWSDLQFMTRKLKGRILDAGCGGGQWTQALWVDDLDRKLTAVDVMAIDEANSGDGQFTYRKNTVSKVVPFVQADIRRLPFKDESFDSILCWRVLHHVALTEWAIREMHRVLKTRGLLCVRVPHDDPRRYPDEWQHPWSLQAFWDLPSFIGMMHREGFELEVIEGVRREVFICIDDTNSIAALLRRIDK